MKSRLMIRLEASILAAKSQPLKADCLRAERAALLARQGQLGEARTVLSTLHTRYSGQAYPAVSAWLQLAESLLGYYSDLSRTSRDKMKRALAQSTSAREMRLQALSAAWLAHMDYANHDFDALARHLAQAFQFASPDHHDALARASLVAAQTYHFGGAFDRAQPWYAKARQHAHADGDEALLSAVMHNLSGLWLNHSRQAALCGRRDEATIRRATMGIESTGNFDALVGSASLTALVPLMRAQICSLQGHWADAVALYEAHFSDGLLQGLDRMRAWLGADLAWCRYQAGQTEQALKDAAAAEIAVAHDHDVDDRAAAHSRLAELLSLAGLAEASARHAERAAADWHTHERDQAHAVALMDKLLVNVTK